MDSHRKRLSVSLICFLYTKILLIWSSLSINVNYVEADSYIGCAFSPTLCIKDIEQCFDDRAFGRCVQQYGNLEDDDFYRFSLEKEELSILENEMQRLFSLGYRWSHTYTQCTLQALLYAFKERSEYDSSYCDHLKDQDLDAALKAIESDVDLQIEPQNMAIVKFLPSLGDPHPDFADEVYYPPLTPDELNEALAIQPPRDTVEFNSKFLEKDEDVPFVGSEEYREFPYSLVKKKSPLTFLMNEDDGLIKRSYPTHFTTGYNTPDHFRSGYESRDENDKQQQQPVLPIFINADDVYLDDFENVGPKFIGAPYGTVEDYQEDKLRTLEQNYYNNIQQELQKLQQQQPFLETGFISSVGSTTKKSVVDFNREYNTPDKFRHGFETKDSYRNRNGFQSPTTSINSGTGLLYHLGFKTYQQPQSQVIFDDEQNQQAVENINEDNDNNDKSLNDMSSEPPRGYTEGGMVFLPPKNNKNSAEEAEEEALSELLSDLDPALGWGFKRRERLDVKKPGPFFSTNNYAFQENKEKNGNVVNAKHISLKKSGEPSDAGSKEMLPEMYYDFKASNLVDKPDKKELALSPDASLDPERYDVVDLDYVYIKFSDSIREWKDGDKVVKAVEKLLKLPKSTFSHVRVDRNEVTFKVDPSRSKQRINASDVVQKIQGSKEKIKRETGVSVTSAGIGNKTKLPPQVLPLLSNNDDDLYIVSFILIGVVGAVIVSAAALYIIRRHAISKEKIKSFAEPDTEASKDYQDLCRARMTGTKPPQEATPAAQRIASLSRESDNSPSSRSSTSSWSEEPALTNMDISTGHMVLSYMEDHLRNKDRLEREWAALCAYEAEPCATTIAQRPENTKKNRYVNALPYDHARVILNELSNISGSDYINASTITDHDPRNPAYIATQGPLPHTTPDLWQMVWEQGCVVMVMLTRLIENDNAMCHRYWPEEGSELYHIYEVHLVSEHIWCDDYLVRSFYLKNLKTGETRTVTQFHFLSWPDGGVPSSIKALLEFRRKVNKSFRGRSCPIVVHCSFNYVIYSDDGGSTETRVSNDKSWRSLKRSDGVGRTGTYCLLDMVLNRMAKGAKEIDIAATLEHIRDQRMGSVATKQQFQLVLAAVAEEVQAILRVLPQQTTQQQQVHQQSEEKKQ